MYHLKKKTWTQKGSQSKSSPAPLGSQPQLPSPMLPTEESSAYARALQARNNLLGLYRTAPRYKAPRIPIVLCHGLFGYSKLGPEGLPFLQLNYWAGVEEALKDLGAQVYTSQVGRTASLKTRAHELRRFIQELSKEKGFSAYNVIGHSMGGLDARYLISHLPSDDFRVASLTTIATPHRGSSFMDFLRDTTGLGKIRPNWNEVTVDQKKRILRASLSAASTGTLSPSSPLQSPSVASQDSSSESVPQMSTRKTEQIAAYMSHPLIRALVSSFDAPAFYNLTTEYCADFNSVSPNSPTTRYYSYAAVVKEVPVLAPLYLPHQIVTAMEGPNDGIVSLESAKWGEFLGVLDCDHWQIVPPKRKRLMSLPSSARPAGSGPERLSILSQGSRGNRTEADVFRQLQKAFGAPRPQFRTVDFYLEAATKLHDDGF